MRISGDCMILSLVLRVAEMLEVLEEVQALKSFPMLID
jgi:hypothetical protein